MAWGGCHLRIRGGDAREASKRRRVSCSGMNVSNQSAETEVGGEVKPVGRAIKEAEEEIERVQADIKGVEAEMRVVEQNIKVVLLQIKHEQDPKMKATLDKRLEQLGDDKKQLGKRQEQLGEKELILLRQSTGSHVPPIAWNESDARLDRMGFCNDNKYFRLDASYLQRDGELLLYCREAFTHLHCFLRERVVEKQALGWIQDASLLLVS